MIKPVLKTLSCAFVVLGAVSTSNASQSPVLHAAAMPMTIGPACAAQVEIERGWEAQQRLLDERLAAKGISVEVPGTIISPPLPDFGTGRTDAKAARAARKPVAPRANTTGSRGGKT